MANTSSTAPDFQTMRDRINNAWNSTVTRMDQNRQRYVTDLGYDPSGLGSYTSQAAALAQGNPINGTTLTGLRWRTDAYSPLANLMRTGSQQAMAVRDNATMRGLSGGIVNQQMDNINYARNAQIQQFGQQYADNMNRMNQAAVDAYNQNQSDLAQVDQAETDYNLENLYAQNPADPAAPATPATPGGVTPPSGGWKQADKLIAQLRARPGKNRKNLDAIYAYIRQNKGKIDPADMKILNKLAAQYRAAVRKNHAGTLGTITPTNYVNRMQRGETGYNSPHTSPMMGG